MSAKHQVDVVDARGTWVNVQPDNRVTDGPGLIIIL